MGFHTGEVGSEESVLGLSIRIHDLLATATDEEVALFYFYSTKQMEKRNLIEVKRH